jgi:hypothetical protein
MSKSIKLATINGGGRLTQIASDDKINSVLSLAAGRATLHTIKTAAGLLLIAERNFVKPLINADLTIKERAGATLDYVDIGAWAKAYRFAMTVSAVTLRLGADGKAIYLDSIENTGVYPKSAGKSEIALTAASHAAWLARQSKRFSIRKSEVVKIAA